MAFTYFFNSLKYQTLTTDKLYPPHSLNIVTKYFKRLKMFKLSKVFDITSSADGIMSKAFVLLFSHF